MVKISYNISHLIRFYRVNFNYKKPSIPNGPLNYKQPEIPCGTILPGRCPGKQIKLQRGINY